MQATSTIVAMVSGGIDSLAMATCRECLTCRKLTELEIEHPTLSMQGGA